jgi:flagellar protein FliL
MAKKEELEVEEGGDKKGKGKLIIIIAAVLLGIGVGAGSVFFLVGGSDSDSDEAVLEEELVPQHQQAIYHRFNEPMIVTVMSGGKQRYLQINVTVKTKDKAVVRLIETHAPVVKSSLNNLFSAQDLNHMQSAQGRMDLNEEALSVVQTFITSKNEKLVVEKVLFTDFVMQ